jgi:hypothetical protein
MKPILRALCIAATLLLSSAAFGQWQWIDKDGRKVFSDRSPPPSVAEKDILKRPWQAKATAVIANPDNGDSATTGAVAVPASAPKISGIDKELAEKKKKAEQDEAAKRKAEDDKVAKIRAENCARAKQSKAGLDAGIRLSQVNKQGEREIMDDAARAAEAQRLQGVIASDCK